MIMLIRLAAKNAILIAEFAKIRLEEGVEILAAAVEGSKLRLRPILMASFALILGCVPLMLASSSGAASRSSMGAGDVFGMTIATTCYLEALYNEQPLFDSELLLAQARRDGLLSVVQLYSALGGGWQMPATNQMNLSSVRP